MISTREVSEQEILEEGYGEWWAVNEADSPHNVDRTDGLRVWVAARKALVDEQRPASPQ